MQTRLPTIIDETGILKDEHPTRSGFSVPLMVHCSRYSAARGVLKVAEMWAVKRRTNTNYLFPVTVVWRP